jgi:hypothetical protein
MVSQQASEGRRAAASNTRSQKSAPTRYTKQAAQENFLALLADGLSINSALERVGRTRKAYELWRREDDKFRARADQAKAMQDTRKKDRVKGEPMDFATFRKRYLNTKTFWHQQQWIDLLEGKEPRDLHPSQTYKAGRKSRLLVNCPPFHAKSMTISMDYVTYRLCMNPSFRVIIVSETARLAEDFLYGIKQRLTHPDYLDMQLAYAPDGGWKQTAESWKQTRITVGASDRDGAEKDPSVQAIGIGGQIYGSRADMVILDDAVTGKNVREFEKQMAWLRREVDNRIEMGGKLLVIGTRIAPTDLYSELMNPDNYGGGGSPWTYLASPAILEENHEDSRKNVTLWPYSDRPWQTKESEDTCECGEESCSDGFEDESGERLYPRWDGHHLEIGPRQLNNATGWALVYQQSSLNDFMTFTEQMLKGATNNARLPGPLRDGMEGHPLGGLHNMYVVAGCDPAIKGYAGLVVVAFDKTDGKRYLLHAFNIKAPTPSELKAEMFRITEEYRVNEWRVEKTGLLQFFTQDESMRLWFQQRGVLFAEHNTGTNKWDPAFGVASCASIFGAYDKALTTDGREQGEYREVAPPQIEFPRHMKGVRDLVHQLLTWHSELDPGKIPCDLVMAFWFVEVRCRELTIRQQFSGTNPLARFGRFTQRRNRGPRAPINLSDLTRTG